MTTADTLSQALGDESISALPADRVAEYLSQRLLQIRTTLLEATVNRALVLVSVDTPESARNDQVVQFDKQIESLHNCIDALQGALTPKTVAAPVATPAPAPTTTA
jgi:hypothetical protein